MVISLSRFYFINDFNMLVKRSRHVLFCMLPNRRGKRESVWSLRGMSDKDCMRGLLFIGRGTWKIPGIYSLSVSVFWRARNVARLSRPEAILAGSLIRPCRRRAISSSARLFSRTRGNCSGLIPTSATIKSKLPPPQAFPKRLAFEINVGEVKQIDTPYP
jgi:hypothetical protein